MGKDTIKIVAVWLQHEKEKCLAWVIADDARGCQQGKLLVQHVESGKVEAVDASQVEQLTTNRKTRAAHSAGRGDDESEAS